jgi:hypothetical protein
LHNITPEKKKAQDFVGALESTKKKNRDVTNDEPKQDKHASATKGGNFHFFLL